jgi:hypothetical protein
VSVTASAHLYVCVCFAPYYEADDAAINQQLITNADVINEAVIVDRDAATLASFTWTAVQHSTGQDGIDQRTK